MTTETVDFAVVVERRETGMVWQPVEWHAVALRPPEDADVPWTSLGGDGKSERFLIGAAPLTLHRSEAEAYLYNLSGDSAPSVYVALSRPVTDDERPELVLLTCDPYEGQSAVVSSERILDAVPMTPPIEAWVRGFVAAHYKEEAFVKRKRKPHDPRKGGSHGPG